MNEDENVRPLPQNDLDLNFLLTNSTWGNNEISSEIKEKLSKFYIETSTTGEQTVTKNSLWGLLSFYTRDMRLANLDNEELNFCRYYLDLAGDYLSVDLVEPFIICISRCATVMETSQSKKGFLRNMQNTLRHENLNQTI